MIFLREFCRATDKTQLKRKTIFIKAFSFYFSAMLLTLAILAMVFVLLKAIGVDTKQFVHEEARSFVAEKWYFVAIIAPVFEELVFRLGLSFKKRHVNISISLFVFFVLSIIWDGYTERILYKLIISTLVFIALSFVSSEFWISFKKKYDNIAIIIITVSFGIIHLVNFSINPIWLPLYIFLCIPQVIMGITFTYLRLNTSFLFAVLAHILVNSFSILFELLVR